MSSIETIDTDAFTSLIHEVGFRVERKNENYGYLRIVIDENIPLDQSCYIYKYDANKIPIVYLSFVMLQWFDDSSDRILFIENSLSYFTYEEIFLFARKALGEDRDLLQAPAIKFSYEDWKFKDVTDLEVTDQKFIMLCSNFVALTLISMWDACLFSMGSLDYIDISEGGLYFYSGNANKLERISKLLDLLEA